MEIPVSMLYAIFTSIILYSAKWYHDHQVITDLKQSKISKEKRLKHVEDEIIKGCLISHGGEITNEALKKLAEEENGGQA